MQEFIFMVADLLKLLLIQLLMTQLEQLLVWALLWYPKYHEDVVILNIFYYVFFYLP